MSSRDLGYLCPPPFSQDKYEKDYSDDELAAWCRDIIADGRSYLRLQPAYPYIQDGLDLINGDFERQKVDKLSDLKTEATVRNIKELVAAQTNIRMIPAFNTQITEFAKQTVILNKGFMAWQGMTFADRKIRKAWQYSCVAGTGYAGIRYDPNFYYKGKGDNVLDAYGPLDVLPVGMGRQHDLQRAYTVAIRVETPVHEAWRLFPDYRDQIAPHRSAAVPAGVTSRAVRFASAILKRFGPAGFRHEHEATPWAMTDVYYIYVDDDSLNETGSEIDMMGPDGQSGTSWCYKVPYVGQELPIGNGKYRKAGREDCLLYPNRRLIIYVDDAGIAVNPEPEKQASPYWHSKVPIVQFRADDWAWNFLGFPLTRYGRNLEKAAINLQRGMVDAMNVRLSPPRAYDRNTQASALAAALDTRIPNQVVGLDMNLGGNPITPLIPFQWYEYPPHFLQATDGLYQKIKDQMGVADATAMARARQLPSGDSLEKLMESLGPLIKDQSRNMEESIRGLGEMWKSNFFQFITAARRLQLLGPDGLAEEDYDYDPGTLIPDSELIIQMHKADKLNGSGSDTWERYSESNEAIPRFTRARWHKDNFSFAVTPYSLHEFNSMTRKLFYLQLQARGFPIDWWTLAQLFDIQNFGPVPKMTDPETGDQREAGTILEKWLAQKEIEIRMQAALQKEAQEAGIQPPGQAGGKGPGRKPSGQQPPTLEQKPGGRSTVRESKH